MKRSTRSAISISLSIVLLFNSVPVLAAGQINKNFVAQPVNQRVSSKLIVKFKPNDLPKGLSVAQINAHMSQALTAQTVGQLQTAAGVSLQQLHAISNGAHVLAVNGKPNRKTMDAAIAGIARLPNVEYVEEDIILTHQAIPVDTYYTTGPTGDPGLWGMQPASAVAAPAPGGTGNYGADFETAWDTSIGTGVVVAVIDTGITPHVDIVGAGDTVAAGAGSMLVSVGYDFITDCRTRASCPASTAPASSYIAPSANATDLGDWITAQDQIDNLDWAATPISPSGWHGTHVAGTIAAISNNGNGVVGGAYSARILPVRALGKGGGSLSDIAEAIRWAADVHATINNPNPAKVINMSLGGQAACTVTLQNAINAAVAAGTVVVVAAGNENSNASAFTPANCANVVTVAATARDGSRAGYSNYSTTLVTLAAPGGDMTYYAPSYDPGILSTVNSGTTTPTLGGGSTYAYYNGTSMAAPHVAAAAALMLSRNPGLTPAQIKTVLSSTASVTAFPEFDVFSGIGLWDCLTYSNCGSGVLNANLAVQNSIFSLTPVGSPDFGSVPTGSTSSSKTIAFVNGSSVSVRTGIATPAITGADAALFSIVSNTCLVTTVAPAASCNITLTYTPVSSATPHSATLTVPTADASVASIVTLTGQPGSALTTLTPTVTATTVTVGQSTTANVTFRNPSATAQPTGSVVLSQPGIMATSADACSNVTLAAATSCVVTVTISPSVAGAYSGTASLGLSGGGTAAVATISGTADPAPTPPAAPSGGGGCSVMPFGATPDASLLLAMLAVGLYWMRRRVIR